jgi:hypothetical protein
VGSRLVLGPAVAIAAALVISACGGGAQDSEYALPEGWTLDLGGAEAEPTPVPPAGFAPPADPASVPPAGFAPPADPASSDGEAAAPAEPTPEPPPEPATDAELAERWWQWAALEAWDTSPLADLDGGDCNRNQPDDVWFLAPSIDGEAIRTCAVPADREIFVPVLARWCDPGGECSFTDPQGAALLDGTALDLIRVSNSTPYEIVGVIDNPVTPSDEPMPVIDTGWWVRVPPLGAGSHELVVYGSSLELEVTVSYDLTVG